MNSRQYDDLVAQLGLVQAENAKLRADLASAREAVLDEVGAMLAHFGYGAETRIRLNALRTPSADPELARTITRSGTNGAASLLEGPNHRPSRSDRPARTITRNTHSDGSIIYHEGDAIVLSERATAILQGFPDGWHFAGRSKAARQAQIGMAMPPPLAEAVFRAIATRAER